MAEQNELQKLKEDNPELFEKTPQEIIDFILADATSEKITETAQKNGVNEGTRIEGIAFRVGLVLLDRLPSGNLAMTLELGLQIPGETAKKIADEINEFIANAGIKQKSEPTKENEIEKPAVEKPPKRPPSKDAYREPVE